jgi:hypothetical protein
VEPEIFQQLAEQERARSRRLRFILAVGLGPALLLAVLGYYDAALTAVFLSLAAGLLFVILWMRYDEELAFLFDPLVPAHKKLLILAVIVFLLTFERLVRWLIF